MGWLFLSGICFVILLALWVMKPEGDWVGGLKKAVGILGAILLAVGGWYTMMFYAQSTYIYHVQTATGNELVVNEIGWNPYIAGTIVPWKKAMTVQSVGCSGDAATSETSTSLLPYKVRLLDRVDGEVCATVRFRLPMDKTKFLEIVHEYRTPANFLQTALIPAWKKTINATSSMMTAEAYYSGGRNEFIYFFEDQMRDGIYKVSIEEKVETIKKTGRGSANVSKGAKENQSEFGDDTKIVYEVVIAKDEFGLPIRNKHNIAAFGVEIVSAVMTDFIPNPSFVERMQKQQDASSERALAKEQRSQKEEARLLAIADGELSITKTSYAAQQAQAKLTTEAETTKQLALTAANQQLEKAAIDKETAAVNLERDRLRAKSTKVLSDADKYKRANAIEADNGLAMKLKTLEYIAKVQADAQARRAVPATVIYSGGDTEGGMGSSNDVQNILNTQLLKNLKALDLDIAVKK